MKSQNHNRHYNTSLLFGYFLLCITGIGLPLLILKLKKKGNTITGWFLLSTFYLAALAIWGITLTKRYLQIGVLYKSMAAISLLVFSGAGIVLMIISLLVKKPNVITQSDIQAK